MFRSLFGSKSDRPAPPKNQIEVVCPGCGAAQYEPRLVVSTFCRKCGVHLSIQRKKVVASDVTRSGVGMPDPWAESAVQEPEVKLNGENHSLELDSNLPLTAEIDQPETNRVADAGELESILKQLVSSNVEATEVINEAEDEANAPPTKIELPMEDEVEETYAAEKRPQSNSPPPTPAPAPMSASTLQKMKSEGMYRNQYFKDADCFDCGHKFKVSRSSRSASCPTCGANISLEDVEVNMPSDQSIKTRGDVLIRKRGQVSAESIQCKDLRCQGTLEANVNASGDAIFRATGTMIGQVHCRRFIVEKGSDVQFLNEIYAEEVDVQARVTGTIISSGSLVIGPNGSMNGDVTARSVSIEPGGELNGAMNIVRTQTMTRPVLG